jgi:hypothetical protein
MNTEDTHHLLECLGEAQSDRLWCRAVNETGDGGKYKEMGVLPLWTEDFKISC